MDQDDVAAIYIKESTAYASSKSFIVIHLSLNIFLFIFVYSVSECSNFILLHVAF